MSGLMKIQWCLSMIYLFVLSSQLLNIFCKIMGLLQFYIQRFKIHPSYQEQNDFLKSYKGNKKIVHLGNTVQWLPWLNSMWLQLHFSEMKLPKFMLSQSLGLPCRISIVITSRMIKPKGLYKIWGGVRDLRTLSTYILEFIGSRST